MIDLPLDKMTVEEKLKTIEVIWEDLCRREQDVPSPSWHGDVLAEREAAIGRGEDVAEDWETAKESIRRELS